MYKIAVHLWNSVNVAGQENYYFFRHSRNNICSFLFCKKRKNACRKSPNN